MPYGKCSFLKVFLILWKIEVESPIFFHDEFDLDYASSHLNIYKATFLFDSRAQWQPEIWHCIFMTTQVSQYVLWDHIVSFCKPMQCPSCRWIAHNPWNVYSVPYIPYLALFPMKISIVCSSRTLIIAWMWKYVQMRSLSEWSEDKHSIIMKNV